MKVAAETQSHLRRTGMSMPVSWVLAFSPGSGEAAQSCGRHASLPHLPPGLSSEGPRMQDAGQWPGFCSLVSAPICCPYSLALGQFASAAALNPSSSHFLLSASPFPQGDHAGRMSPPRSFHLEPSWPHSVWPGACSVPICSNSGRASQQPLLPQLLSHSNMT